MRREGLRSQVNNMNNNEYKKLENNEELEKISLNEFSDNNDGNKKTHDTAKLISASDSENDDKENSKHDEPVVVYKQNLKKDFNNICLLMFLYFLQGLVLLLS
jgi:hypothetical protein